MGEPYYQDESVTLWHSWRDDAACRDLPAPFYPDHTTGDAYAPALAICRDCPVRAACLEAALAMEGAGDARSRYGVWGGTTPEDRARMMRRRKRVGGQPRPECGTANGYRWHLHHGEDPCDACREANRVRAAEQRAARKARAEAAS